MPVLNVGGRTPLDLRLVIDLDSQSPEVLEQLRGPKGDRGMQGPKGDKGDSPSVGEVAFELAKEYANALRGLKGDKGDKGEPSTAPGPPGARGPQGPGIPAGALVFWPVASGPIPEGWVEAGLKAPAWWEAVWAPAAAPVLIRKV